MRWLHPLSGFVVLAAATCGCGHDKPASGDGGRPDATADAWPADASVDGADDGDHGAAEDGSDGAIAGRHVIRVTTADPAKTDVDDGLCSLSEAITAVNGRAAVNTNDCPAGTGNDIIELPPGTYETATTLELTASAEIRGAGMGASAIAVARQSLTCGVRLATLDTTVWLTNLTLRPAMGVPPPGNLTGVCVTAGRLRIRHARVTGFTAGGLRAEAPIGGYAKLEIYNALIDGNRNPGDGGGIAFVGPASSISIDQSSIINNVSDGMGGGLFAAGGMNANYIYDTTFSGNVARRGGGVAAHVLSQTYFGLYWSTVAFNRALDVAGGLFIEGETLDAHGTATGSLITGNRADGDAAQANLNAAWAPGFSCTSSMLDVSALAKPPLNIADSCRYAALDPRLGPLMDMGGGDHLPIHPLLPGSPAIDSTDDFRLDDIVEQRDGWNGTASDPPIGTNPGDTPRWTLFGRDETENPLSDMGAYEFNPRWEAELLTVADGARDEHAVVTTPPGFSHGAGTMLRATAATASTASVTYQVPVPEAGRHAITVRIGTGNSQGTLQVLVGDAAAGPFVPIGAMQDGYSATADWKTIDLGDVTFASFGQKFFKFAITGKNDQSQGHELVLDYLSVTKQ